MKRKRFWFSYQFSAFPMPPTDFRQFYVLTHGDVVTTRDAHGDPHNHLADLHGGDVVRLAQADPHAGQSVIQVHER